MPTIVHKPDGAEAEDKSRVQVAVGILRRGDLLLVQRRLAGTPCAGQWEFPGGKAEVGETPRRALARELQEELGVAIDHARLLMKLPVDYPHARVLLHTFTVDAFAGEATAVDGQAMRWLTADAIRRLDILPAVPVILDGLRGSP